MRSVDGLGCGVVLLALLVACGGAPPPPRVDGTPYLVLVTIDTLRADATSPYGAPAEMTPNLTAFARQSVQFDRAFATMPTTGPSHLAILTGLYPQEFGALQNGVPARPGTRSLAAIMRTSGRRTAAFVSVHHLSRETLRLDGFETWDAPEETRDGKDTVAAAEDWIDDLGGAPFFLWVHLFDPHQPYKAHATPPAELAGRLDELKNVDVPGHGGFDVTGLTPEQREKLRLLYQADVHYADAQLGRLLAILARRGLDERTAIVVTSDHGEVLGEAIADFGYGFDHGEFLLPMEVRVPLWVRVPGGRQGVVEERTIETRAIFATLASEAAMPQAGAASLPGLEAAPADVASASTSAFIVRRSFQSENLPDVLRGTRIGEASDGTLLVRVARDHDVRIEGWQCGDEYPTGLVPAALAEPEITRRLSQLESWTKRFGTNAAAPSQAVDTATKERLRVLGYLD